MSQPPTTTPASERCSLSSRARGDDLAGTATPIRPFLLVENDGPWGVEALRDARMDPAVLDHLRTASAAAGVRVLLVRRYGRTTTSTGAVRVIAAYAHPVTPWAEQAELGSVAAVTELDLVALAAGRSLGLDPVTRPVIAVCTHGRHDTCCAEQGRPVAAALADERPEQTWECSHLGGDRFAGNLLVLPHGLYYGRLDPPSARLVAAEVDAGRLELDHLRGRTGYAMPVQAAEIALRRELGETRIEALRLRSRTRDGAVTRTTWSVAGRTYEVGIRTTSGPAELLTCRALRPNPVPRHELVALR